MAEDQKVNDQLTLEGQGSATQPDPNQGTSAPEPNTPQGEAAWDFEVDGQARRYTAQDLARMIQRDQEYDGLQSKIQKMTHDFGEMARRASQPDMRNPIPQTPAQTALTANDLTLTEEDLQDESKLQEKFNRLAERVARPGITEDDLDRKLDERLMRREANQMIAADPFLSAKAQVRSPDGRGTEAEVLLATAITCYVAEGMPGEPTAKGAWDWFKSEYGVGQTKSTTSEVRVRERLVNNLTRGGGTPSGNGGTEQPIHTKFFDGMTQAERVAAMKKDPKLFEELLSHAGTEE